MVLYTVFRAWTRPAAFLILRQHKLCTDVCGDPKTRILLQLNVPSLF